jgi:hypothetical protein
MHFKKMSFLKLKKAGGNQPNILKMFFFSIKKSGRYPPSILKMYFFEKKRLVDTHLAF